MAPRVVLVGAPGAGKSTVGRRVAEALKVPFADSDALVEKQAGKSVSDIFISDGEDEFRRMETEVIHRALQDFAGVLSLGGGAILNPDTRRALECQHVIWLQVDLTHATQRVGLNSSRPLLLGNVRGTMLTMLEKRTPLYADVATDVIDTSGKPIKEIVQQALDLLESSEGPIA